VVVDVQYGFVVPHTAPTVPTIAEFLRRERHRYAIVIATRFVNRIGSLYQTERDWSDMICGDEVELLPEVARAADMIISKHGLAPDPRELVPALRREHLQRVDLCGFDTDQCVLATALLLWDQAIVPRVLADLCSSSGGREMHEAGLAIARRAIGDRNVTVASADRHDGAEARGASPRW
jgi:nicotinamidase-related amidase